MPDREDQARRGRLSRLRSVMARRKSAAGDSGQALVMAVIAVAVIAVLVPIVGSAVATETVQVNRASLSESALAAARAGLNDYRTYIDSNPAYYAFVCGAPHNNLAMGSGTPTYACNTWEPVSGTTNEWFHYIPDRSQLIQSATTSGSPKEMLLEVTGRAGAPSDYTYRTILAGFTLSGILTDSYYSDYEVTDPLQPNAFPTVTVKVGGVTTNNVAMSSVEVTYAEQTTPGTYQYYGPESLVDALCEYHTFSENTFIDSLGTVTNQWIPGKPIASYTNPYYGPFYDAPPLTINIPNTLPNATVPPDAGGTITIPSGSGTSVCSILGQGIYPGSVTFNGIAYTNDQLALCGDPTFNGNPPLESGAPTLPYKDDWPGSVYETPTGLPAGYYPKGYTYSFTDGCSSSSQPTYGPTVSDRAPVLNQNQALPTNVSGLLPYADGQQSGSVGCLFTGPTMIQFLPGGLMNVWSPLSQNTNPYGSVAQQQACGTYTPGQPYQMGLAVPQASNGGGGVIYVEGEQTTGPNSGWWSSTGATCSATLTTGCYPKIISNLCSTYSSVSPPPAYDVNVNTCVPSGSNYVSEGQALNPAVTSPPTGDSKITAATCIDPYLSNTMFGGTETDPGTVAGGATTCEQGDAIVEGEFRGLLTLAATNNVIVSRDLTYQCVDGGGVSNANPGTTAACNAAGTNDELALVPDNDLVVSMPLNEPFNSNCSSSTSNGCGTAAGPICTDDGTGATQNVTNVVPWSCDVDTSFSTSNGGLGGNGITIDAAVVDLTGSTIAQNFSVAAVNGSASMFQNGTNINYFAGFNGTTGGDGYNQIITYDQRLSYENPPGLLQATNTVWNVSSFVVCGTIDTSRFAPVNPNTATAYQQINCPSQA